MNFDVKGVSVFANTGGKPLDTSGPVAILVHGSGCDHSIWGGQNRYLAHHGSSVLAIDLPGHGRSGGQALDSIADVALFLIDVIDELKLEKPILVGHSMGALAVLEASARLGDRCAGLGLCGVASAMPVHPDLLGAAERNELVAAELISSWGHGGKAHRGGNPVHGIWMLRQAVVLIDSSRPGVLHTDLKACADYDGAPDAAARVTCPTLFLLGRADKMTPAKAAKPLSDAISGSETIVLESSGHMMMIEDPRGACKALTGLVEKVAA